MSRKFAVVRAPVNLCAASAYPTQGESTVIGTPADSHAGNMKPLELLDVFTFDRVLAVVGFGIAIWQIWKTRSAAEAAKVGTDTALNAIRRLESATKMQDIASRSRELLRLLRSTALSPAASAAFELRDSVARYRHDKQSKQVVDEAVWSKAVEDVRLVHERLESLGMTTRSSPTDREALLHEVGRLHTLFTSISAKAAAEGTSDVHAG